MRIIGITNQKGGVGKTTSAMAFAALFASRGDRTLLVDYDGQGDSTKALNKDAEDAGRCFVQGLRGNLKLQRLARKIAPNLWLVRNGGLAGDTGDEGAFVDELYALRHELDPAQARALLRNLLDSGRGNFDTVIIDSAPVMGFPRQLLLHACDELVVPVELEQACLEGLSGLTRAIEVARANGAGVRLTGILGVGVQPRRALSVDMFETLGEYYRGVALRTYIREDAALPRSWAVGRLRTFTSRSTNAANDYRDAFVELCNRINTNEEAAA